MKDGSIRLYVRYRRLSNINTKDLYPLPRRDDFFYCIQVGEVVEWLKHWTVNPMGSARIYGNAIILLNPRLTSDESDKDVLVAWLYTFNIYRLSRVKKKYYTGEKYFQNGAFCSDHSRPGNPRALHCSFLPESAFSCSPSRFQRERKSLATHEPTIPRWYLPVPAP